MTSQVNDPTQAPNPQTQAQAQAQVVQQQQDVSEVGWMFIQQYYTFVNNKPHQLHLFYTTSSTLCHGVEGQAVPSYRGQTQIQQRMREHGFQDCKVMVSNVDVQGSADGGVVVQVLGEMANAGRPSQKFCQTFFLAPQPRGYYVLNDILRFLKEDVDVEDDSAAAATAAPNATVSNDSLFAQKLGADEQLNGHHSNESNGSNGSNGTVGAQEKVVSAPAPVPASAPAPTQVPQVQTQQPQATPQAPQVQPSAAEDQSKPAVEKAQSPAAATAEQKSSSQPKAQSEKETKPVAKQAAKTAAPKDEQKAPAQPAKPSAPLTWADKIKPASAPSTTSAGATSTATAATATAEPNGSATRNAAAPTPASTTAQGSGAASGKRSSQSGQRQRPEFHSAYIKHVTQKVDDGLLKQALERIGKLTHFQVEKSKSCAFVDFIDEATLKNALAVHELKVGDQTVLIEERKRGGAKKNSGTNSKNRNSNSKRKA